VLRRLANIYYRAYNDGDGDSYNDAIEMGKPHILPRKGYKSKDVEKVAHEVENMVRMYAPMSLYEERLNQGTDHLLRAIMLHNSTKDNIWNPETNHLVYKCEDSK